MSHAPSRRRTAEATESDAQALSRIVCGELGALGVLYDRHYLPVLRFAQRMTRDAADAEDVAQEVFLTAARIASSFDGRESCRPWLYGIATRLLLHRGRRSARLARFLERLIGQPRDTCPTPHEALVRREGQLELERALAKLPTKKRVVLVLAEVEGLSCDEIAHALQIPVGTVWTRLHHARRALRARLQGSGR